MLRSMQQNVLELVRDPTNVKILLGILAGIIPVKLAKVTIGKKFVC